MSDEPLTKTELAILGSYLRVQSPVPPHSSMIQDLVRRGYIQLLPVLTPKALKAIGWDGKARLREAKRL